MDSLLKDFERSMSNDSQHYASNDSGLSSNSNGGDIDSKCTLLMDFPCDDLTKSLFINSIGGNELIHDDDIYSYKNKLEIQNMFNNKFRSFNFPKSDNFKIRNSYSFSSIIQDLENLKESEPLSKHSMNIPVINMLMKEKANLSPTVPIIKQTDYINEIKSEPSEKIKLKKPVKKSRQPNNSNNVQEYVSSSIKNYKGNKSLNEIVHFIQGTSSNDKQNSNKSKSDKNVMPTVKPDNTSVSKFIDLSVNGFVTNEEESSVSKQSSITNSIIIDGDSGTQSHFVSLNNSDEDTHKLFINDFQEVLPKSRKKQKKQPTLDSHVEINKSQSDVQVKPKSPVKSSKPTKKNNQKMKYAKPSQELVSSTCIDLLDTKHSFQKFLSDQFSVFMKLSIMVS